MDKEAIRKKLKKYQWVIYIIMVLAYLLCPFARGALAIMMPDLTRDLTLNATQVGLIGLAYFWVYALINAPVGSLLDRIGTRKGITLNLTFIGIGCFVFSIAGSVSGIIIGRMIMAVGAAGLMVTGVKALSSWFTTKQFPALYGVWMGIGALGGVLATAPLRYMMNSFGWRYSFALIAAACIIFAVFAYLIVRSHPADIGLDTPDELAGEAVNKGAVVPDVSFWDATKQTLKTPIIWLVALYLIGLGASSNTLLSLWGGVFLKDAYGLSMTVVTEILTIAAFAAVAGCFAAGAINKRIGSAGVMLSATILFLLAWLYMTIKVHNLSVIELKVLISMVAFLQMYGVVAAFTVVRISFPVSRVGFATGFANSLCWMGVGVFQQIWGIIIRNVSKGISPYPVEAFQYSFWAQSTSLVISLLCAIYMSRLLWKSASNVQKGSSA